jgi:hypothetical protein
MFKKLLLSLSLIAFAAQVDAGLVKITNNASYTIRITHGPHYTENNMNLYANFSWRVENNSKSIKKENEKFGNNDFVPLGGSSVIYIKPKATIYFETSDCDYTTLYAFYRVPKNLEQVTNNINFCKEITNNEEKKDNEESSLFGTFKSFYNIYQNVSQWNSEKNPWAKVFINKKESLENLNILTINDHKETIDVKKSSPSEEDVNALNSDLESYFSN